MLNEVYRWGDEKRWNVESGGYDYRGLESLDGCGFDKAKLSGPLIPLPENALD